MYTPGPPNFKRLSRGAAFIVAANALIPLIYVLNFVSPFFYAAQICLDSLILIALLLPGMILIALSNPCPGPTRRAIIALAITATIASSIVQIQFDVVARSRVELFTTLNLDLILPRLAALCEWIAPATEIILLIATMRYITGIARQFLHARLLLLTRICLPVCIFCMVSSWVLFVLINRIGSAGTPALFMATVILSWLSAITSYITHLTYWTCLASIARDLSRRRGSLLAFPIEPSLPHPASSTSPQAAEPINQ